MIRIAPFALVCALAYALTSSPATAQDEGITPSDPPAGSEDGGIEEGMDLLGEGMNLFLRGLMEEIQPEIERLTPELRRFATEMGPMIESLSSLVDEIDLYHLPERLPNGDIIIRRKSPEEQERDADPEVAPEGGIDI